MSAYAQGSRKHSIGRLVLDADRRRVTWESSNIKLTRIEFEIMHILCENYERVVRKNALIDSIWGEWDGDDHLVEVHISRLRRKLSKNTLDVSIRPVRGVGYKLIIDEPSQ